MTVGTSPTRRVERVSVVNPQTLAACVATAAALCTVAAIAVRQRGQFSLDRALACSDADWDTTILTWKALVVHANVRDLGQWHSERHCPSRFARWRPAAFGNVSAGDVVFLRSESLGKWQREVLPKISTSTPFILVTAGPNIRVTEVLSPRDLRRVLSHPALVGLWAQNADADDAKLHSLPIGLSFNRATHAQLVQGFAQPHLLRPWGLMTTQLSTGREHASLLQLIATLPPTRKRKLAAWCDFQFDGDNPVRLAIWTQLRSSPETAAATIGPLASLAKHEMFATKAQYMFDISPPGHGIDCFRTWEALALGMIPIVLRSGTPLDELLRELPVVLVASFSEVTLPQLRVWAREIEERRQRKAWGVVRVPVPTGPSPPPGSSVATAPQTIEVPAQVTTAYWLQTWRRALANHKVG